MNETHTFCMKTNSKLVDCHDNGICKVSAQSPLSSYNDYQGIKGSVLDIVQSFGRIFIASWQGVFYQSLESGKYEREIFSPIKQILSQAWDLENVVLKNKNYLLAATSDGVFIIDSLLKTTRVAEGNFNYVKARNDNNELVYAGGAQTIKYLDFSNDILNQKLLKYQALKAGYQMQSCQKTMNCSLVQLEMVCMCFLQFRYQMLAKILFLK